MTHLTLDEMVDAVEGMLARDRRAHIDSCPVCRGEVAQLSAVLGDARAIDVPEPSPLFWDRFSARVRYAIASETVPHGGWVPRWLRVPVLVPLGALALMILALSIAIPRDHQSPANDVARGAADVATSDAGATGVDGWAVLSELVGAIELESAGEAGIAVGPGTADLVALNLSTEERHELVRLLKEELSRQ